MNIKFFFWKIHLSLIFPLFGADGFAQPPLSEYYPIGTTWEEVYTEVLYRPGDAFDGTFKRYNFSVDCDTIIGGKRYKIVSQITTENLAQPSDAGAINKFLLREQCDSILVCDNLNAVREKLIYNFNWQETDSLLISVGNKYEKEHLTHSYEILLDGNSYECFYFSSSLFFGDKKYVYKSIGQTIGGIIDGSVDAIRTTRRKRLTKFTRNNVLIYENEYPTPQVNAIYDVSYKEKNERQDCYTLQGVKVDVTNLKSGFYIQNGRKFIVK